MIAALLAGVLAATMLGAVPAAPAAERVVYTPDTADIANPDRGLYHHTGDCDATTFDPAVLRAYRTEEHISLVMCVFYLRGFQDAPISAAALRHLEDQAAAVRAAGLKMVLRFAYTDDPAGDDAPVERVLSHIGQLTPYLRENADVIHVMQAGFVGAWGEWYYTQHFGNEGVVSATDQANRRRVVDRLLQALPASRQVQLRTPGYKRTLYGTEPVGAGAAYTDTPQARVGHHNDCFLAPYEDYGTYVDPAVEYPYLRAETLYVAMGGETCVTNPPRSDCPTALEELSGFHWTFLNTDYQPDVLRGWAAGGCLDTVRRSLGYRLRLTESTVSVRARELTVRLGVRNDGWAAPINPRGAELVLRDGARVHRVPIPSDPRRWAGDVSFTVPTAGIPSGRYQLLLNLPDASPALRNRPEYSIRLATVDTWEPATGFNDLHQTVSVTDGHLHQ
ncbi:DUF4832 domain-containing protein [Symbioplanes lichenis]|uniref:DUF4832 domain-containing protein n=1 Tax=Symbioplanes lichenis TaxID=1629072 RepID=UPI00273A13A2|nr:DUF4832 domain-containing protein [Actinoplanes lichenis]